MVTCGAYTAVNLQSSESSETSPTSAATTPTQEKAADTGTEETHLYEEPFYYIEVS